jgi:hypothetical protein
MHLRGTLENLRNLLIGKPHLASGCDHNILLLASNPRITLCLNNRLLIKAGMTPSKRLGRTKSLITVNALSHLGFLLFISDRGFITHFKSSVKGEFIYLNSFPRGPQQKSQELADLVTSLAVFCTLRALLIGSQ